MKPTIPIQTKPSKYFANSSVRFMTVHWRYARQKTRAMQKCTSLPITTVTTRMENSPVMWLRGQATFPIKGCKAERKSMFGLQTKVNIRKENKSLMSFGQMLFLLWTKIPLTVGKKRSKVKYGLTDYFNRINFIYECSTSILTFRPRLMCVHLSTLPMVSSLTWNTKLMPSNLHWSLSKHTTERLWLT